MTAKGQDLRNIDGGGFFNCLQSKTSGKTYNNLYDFMKITTEQLSQEQSFFTLDLADVLWKIQLWQEKLPGIVPFYAVKAHSDPVLIRLFILLGFSFDCSTKGEIDLILKNGGKPQNIIYAHTIKPHTSLKYAMEVGVDLLTFDSEEELLKIKKFYPTARLVVRIKGENPQCSYDLNVKYGCHLEDVKQMLITAKDLNLNVVGVSFHVGALCVDPTSYSKTIHSSRTLFDFAEELGFHFTILDIGGGFFGSKEKENFFDEVTSEIKNGIEKYFPGNSVQVIAEPGCYFVGSAQRNVTCVLGKRSVNKHLNAMNGDQNEIGKNGIERHYFVNDGYYGSFFRLFDLYDIYARPLLKQEETKKRPVYKSTIWGQTCCCEDYIVPECSLPEMNDGEYLVWENMGAYSFAVATEFTIVPLPQAKRVFIKNPRLQLDWIENLEEVMDFLANNVVLIESEDFP